MSSAQNRQLLVRAARLLQPLIDEIVFVGGCTTALLTTDEAAPDVRPTYDVDVVVDAATYVEYERLSTRLREIGLEVDTREDAPNCRWRHEDLTLDVMPLGEAVLGFTNRWYPDVLRTAETVRLDDDLEIRVVTSPYFVATKLEAFRGRGKGSFLSPDLEDLVAVVDGRPTLIKEVERSAKELRVYVASELHRLLENPDFVEALPGFLQPDDASQGRLPFLLERLKHLGT